MFGGWLPANNPIVTVAVFLATYLLTLAIGRVLKRRTGVRFGVMFQLFALTLAFYAAIGVYGLRAPWHGHVGALLVLLSTAVVVLPIDRYVWEYYFEKRRQKVISGLLRDMAAEVIFLNALLLVLSIGFPAQT